MELDTRNLHFSERTTLRQIMKAKVGKVTVREAREFCAPQGKAFAFKVVGVTTLCLALGLLFLPLLLVAPFAPIFMILMQRSRVARWRTILPPEHDAEPLLLT